MTTDTASIQILRAELSRRVRQNPRYSLRAFSKSLGFSHTALSLILSGKRPLSRKAAVKMSERLGLDPAQTAALVGEAGSRAGRKFQGTFTAIDLDTFAMISDWIHYAILSLLEIRGAQFEPKWIAKRLGTGEVEVRQAMNRLLNMGMVGKKNGRWRQISRPIKVDNRISTAATRKFQRGLLEKAIESLENDPVELRDFSSMTFCVDPKQVAYAKERIKQFRRELTAELEAKGRAREVYNLTVQLYPVSKEIDE